MYFLIIDILSFFLVKIKQNRDTKEIRNKIKMSSKKNQISSDDKGMPGEREPSLEIVSLGSDEEVKAEVEPKSIKTENKEPTNGKPKEKKKLQTYMK